MNVYNIFSKKTIDFKAEPLMFLDLASCMKSLYSISQQYLHKAERTFPSSVSILKSFANGHFLKVAINTVSLLSSDIFSPKSWRERNNQVPCKYYNKLEKYLSLSIYIKTLLYTHKNFVFSMENNCNIIYEGEQLLIH